MREEQEQMTTEVDRKIVRRLLGYGRKHALAITFSLFLLVLVVGVELIRPVLIGRAVDEVIVNYTTVYSEVGDPSIDNAITVGQRYLIEDESNRYPDAPKAMLVYGSKGYHLAYDLTYEEAVDLKVEASVWEGDSGPVVVKAGREYATEVMSQDAMTQLRMDDFRSLLWLIGLYLALLIVGMVISYYQTVLLHYTGQRIIYEIREEIFEHIQALSVEFFNDRPVGQLVTRVTNDTENLNEMYTNVVVNAFRSTLTMIGIGAMMFILSWRLSLAVFTVLPLIVFATWLFRRHSRKAYRDVRSHVSAMNSFLSEHISGMKILQIFHREDRKLEEFDGINTDLKKANLRQLFIFGIYRPSMYFIYTIALALVLGYGGRQVMSGVLTIGVLVMFIQYVNNFFDPIQQLAEQFNILQSAFASAEKIFSLLDETEIIEDKDGAEALEEVRGHIEFKNVSFAYTEDEYVLKDVSFTVEPGETVAFVGATGAGKTSILNLLSRYYDIQKGDILIDGKNIKDLKKHSIRQHIGQMLQDVFLFTGDISDNIRLGDETVTDEDMIEATKYVNAHPFISRLKDQYKEHVYERGATFSAGQRQLLSFARTLAYKPSVLVLDEATANIDTETELLIQDALAKLMEGRTTLVVAHRLSTIQHADKIVVLHKGRVKEIGNHQTLLANKGLYYNLYKLQYQE